ncbi:ATP-binding protein [Halarcobacter sp.]|uniref:ATP-binding protein n=1 Tax=Halarcobacter sp. TaxID=2321133 RepID=UPI0029F46FA5|nr:ATP-binding protein [Halarcobacter sp.]
MKLAYRIIIPLVLIVTILFTALLYFFISSEKTIMKEAQVRNSQKIIEQFENDKENRLEEEKNNLNFIAKTISRVSSKYVYDYDIESIGQTLKNFLEVSNIKAIEIFEKDSNSVFYALYKNGKDLETDIKKANFNKSDFKTIKQKIFWEADNLDLGFVEVYYDDSVIINKFKKSKENLFEKLEESNKKQEDDTNKAIYNQVFILVVIALILFMMILYLTYKRVLNPLKTLNTGLNDFFLFLQNKNDHANKIEINTNDEFGTMAKSLNENISVSAKLHEEIYELNTNLEERINERTQKISSLLDNADQGFLSFSNDLIIDSEYSNECRKIFKKEIAGISIGELLYEDNKDKKEFFEETLSSLFGETNELKIKNIISLLQEEFRINRKAIHVKYKLIEKQRFMLIFTDITAKKLLEKKIKKERDTLKMIVSVITDSDEFFELIDEFRTFSSSKLSTVDKTKTSLHNTTVLYRTIHTFKGLFSQKEMKFLVKKLHEFETVLSKLLKEQNTTNENLIELLKQIDFDEYLNKEIDTIKSILGDELFNKRGKIVVKEETLSKIEEEICEISQKSGLFKEYEHVIDDIKSLRDRPIYTMFNSYTKLVDQLSLQLKKHIYPLDIIVNKELLVKDEVKPFIKSLVHVFRNCVDHGIETMEERFEKDKDEIGTISCTISEDENSLHIIIADDGKGIDIDKVKSKAETLGIDISNMSKDEILELIFEDKFSTAEKISTVSGRGVGMSVVKDELLKLNGTINITTQKEVGTTFEFIIPR